jgi:hypothetical protein
MRFHIEKPWHPLMAPLHFSNKKVIDEISKNNFFQDLEI